MRELGTGVSRKETLVGMGMTGIRVAKKAGVQDGIEKVRSMFSRMYFDERKTERLIKALQMYRKQFDEKLGTFKDKPFHDTHSHYCDCIRVMCVGWHGGSDMGSMGYGDDEIQNKEPDNFFAM